MSTVLEKILAQKQLRLLEQRKSFPLKELERKLAEAEPVRDAWAQILRPDPGSIPVIAELKRKSPSAGEMRMDLSPAQLARAYEEAGARAISVLCEQDHFGGRLEDLLEAKKNCGLPVLCKDFIISSFQVLLARLYGADLILLIVKALEQRKLLGLYRLAREMMMTPLVEAHNRAELELALSIGARLIGINNRDLATLEVNLDTTRDLLPLIPKDRIVVSESGFQTRAELEEFRSLGVKAFLIGGSILASADPGQKLRELVHGQG